MTKFQHKFVVVVTIMKSYVLWLVTWSRGLLMVPANGLLISCFEVSAQLYAIKHVQYDTCVQVVGLAIWLLVTLTLHFTVILTK